ncbi:carbon monoxide dehydrogenase subunit G [Rhizobium sp. FKL33]|uniref:SRPBCC family protein n=1 Tax=Rhizobium sp. FKL33 TaxID=2562307 RepID=UPI0010C06479|nr:carbon monoxide dehydrogenase subunit G [Rhizobium sp. FKL33]
MDLTGEERIAAPRDTVWAALNNPDILSKCIPGCQSLEITGDNQMAAVSKLKIGPVSATFKGTVTLSNIVPPESYTISGEGSGGIAGFAKGGADVKLTADGDHTILAYAVNAKIGGKLAMLGSRLIDSSSKKLAEKFFRKLNKAVTNQAITDDDDED